MENLSSYVFLSIIIVGFTYGLIRQIQHTLTIQKTTETKVYKYKRTLFGNYVTSISFLGFLLSFVINIAATSQVTQASLSFINKSAVSSFVFLAIVLISKFFVTPKQKDQLINDSKII